MLPAKKKYAYCDHTYSSTVTVWLVQKFWTSGASDRKSVVTVPEILEYYWCSLLVTAIYSHTEFRTTR
jgi:hypothetical protein